MSRQPATGSEFSCVIRPSELGPAESRFVLEADAPARAALAERFGLVSLDSLSASVRLKWVRGGRLLRLSGRLRAAVTQSCVVTLEPVENLIEEDFEILYRLGPGGEPAAAAAAAEPLDGDSLDIAEAVAEEVALLLDPYPRKPGANLDLGPAAAERGGEAAQTGRDAGSGNKPFEGLAALRGNK